MMSTSFMIGAYSKFDIHTMPMQGRRLLQKLLDENPKFSKQNLSTSIGRGPAYLHQYLVVGSPRELHEDDRRALAKILNINPNDLRETDTKPRQGRLTSSKKFDSTVFPASLEFIMVRGAVQAGYWTEALQWPEDDWYAIPALSFQEYPVNDRFALVMKGCSMDKVYPEGTYLDCVNIYGVKRSLKTGDRVIVQREHGGQCEATVKELEISNSENRFFLWPRSNDPNFQGALMISDLHTPQIIDSTTVRITALVVGSYRRES